MPRLDGTGPMGQGPMTGRGMGWCAIRVPGGRRSLWWIPAAGWAAWQGARRFMAWRRRFGPGARRAWGWR